MGHVSKQGSVLIVKGLSKVKSMHKAHATAGLRRIICTKPYPPTERLFLQDEPLTSRVQQRNLTVAASIILSVNKTA